MKMKSIVSNIFVLVKLDKNLITCFNLKLNFDQNYLPNNPIVPTAYFLEIEKNHILNGLYILLYV